VPDADRHWLNLTARVDRTGHSARAYCRFFSRLVRVRLVRLALRLGRRLAKRLGRIARACCLWILFVLFALVMDVVMTLDLLIAYPVRGLRWLRASWLHSTEWHVAKFDGRWLDVRRMSGSEALEIRAIKMARKETP
jgi:hypothetical protein